MLLNCLSAKTESGAMPCDKHTLAVLELPKVLEKIASLCLSPMGAEMVRSLTPSSDLSAIERRQRRLSQLKDLLLESDPPGLEGLNDLSHLFERLAVAGIFLTPPELEKVADFLSSVGSAYAFLDNSADRYAELFRLQNRITPLPAVAKRLRQLIGPGHSVSSQASAELGRIRRELAKSREHLRSQLSMLVSRDDMAGVFSDQIVTQRGGRFVVPMRTDAKGRLVGIIHDTSGTGQTCFVEPLEAVEGNNQLALSRRREQEEEERILREATAELATHRKVLQENLEALSQLDCLLAQAEFCRRLETSEPGLNRQGILDLPKVRHPLLAWQYQNSAHKAVPIAVKLGGSIKVLVISGANAGGKTATLKTVGLVCLMVMCGLQPPSAPGSNVAVFDRILAEIGDDQDLGRELSTFTAHAGRLAYMAREAKGGSLILVDEIGGGTDPNEGASLAAAVLGWLMERGASVICTTHFHRLKAYAALTAGVENVSVAFDQSTGQATYQLHYGLAGFSDALAVSRRLNFPPGLVERAEAQLEDGQRQVVALLEEAGRAKQEALALQQQAAASALAAVQDRREARELLKSAQRERAGALADGKRRVREVAKKAETRLKELIDQVQADKEQGRQIVKGRALQEVYEVRRQALAQTEELLSSGLPEYELESGLPAQPIQAGDQVMLVNLNQRGVILESPKAGVAVVPVSVGVSGVRIMAALKDISVLPKSASPAQPKVSVTVSADDGLDLNIVGKTVDEALPLLDKAVDQAIIAGRGRFRVIHGQGTGRLKQAVRQYLADHPYVATVGRDMQAGAGGVTVVELKD